MLESPPTNPEVRTEPSDVNALALWSSAAGLAALIAVSFVVVVWVFDGLKVYEVRFRPSPSTLIPQSGTQLPPEPRLEEIDRQRGINRDVHADSFQGTAAEPESLTHYGWVDPKKRIGQIPIDRAMHILTAERPLPVRASREEKR
jgi:hypothetical protein